VLALFCKIVGLRVDDGGDGIIASSHKHPLDGEVRRWPEERSGEVPEASGSR
jgi:hypothetical protein